MSCNILFKKENIRNDVVHRLKMHAVQSRWNVVSYTYTRTHTHSRGRICVQTSTWHFIQRIKTCRNSELLLVS